MTRRHMYAPCLVAALLLSGLALVCVAQNSQTGQSKPQPTPAATLHARAQLVVLDISVQDGAGHPVHGLKLGDFIVTEQKKPQRLRYFDEHTASAAQKPGPPMPTLPPGTFTNYTPFPPDSTLNILLVDALNTPMEDQVYVRQQLLDFVKREKPGTRTAIFGLTNRLIMLQAFTSDPAALQAAVEHKLLARPNILLDGPAGGQGMSDMGNAPPMMTNGGYTQAAASMQQFEAEEQSLQIQMRQQYTLDAFSAMAHYLSNLPGRKNLIWFSGSFPLEIAPNPTLQDPFAVMRDSNQEFRDTTNLLTASRTAVYPIDARGLMTQPVFAASNRRGAGGPGFAAEAAAFSAAQAAEHATMEQMASDTGGQAFYNTNGLWQAAQKALQAGSSYYTVAYIPEDRNLNGAYHHIHVELTGANAAQRYRLSYRQGYYADDAEKPSKAAKQAQPPAVSAPRTPAPATIAERAAGAYTRSAIARGAPTPSDILFKVRVVPLTGKNDDTLAADNKPDPKGKMKPPYRTFAIDYVALPAEFSLTAQTDGRHTGAIDFMTFVYDEDGYLLNILDKRAVLNLTPEVYKDFMSNPVRFRLLVSAPVKQESFLRVVLRDVPANHYGAVEIPTAEVGNLPALQAQDTSASAPKPAENTDAPHAAGKQ